MDVQIPEDTKDCNPEDEEDDIPAEMHIRFNEWNHVDESRQDGESGDDLSVDPFRVGIGVDLARIVKIGAVQTTDSEAEDKLAEEQHGAQDETWKSTSGGSATIEDAHFLIRCASETVTTGR